MAASASGGGKVSMRAADGKALVAAKIQEGISKVTMLEQLAEKTDHDIEVLRKQVEDMAALMQFELRLDEYCSDLGYMHKARLDYHGGSLSKAERRSLEKIHDLAASAIADYEAVIGPAPAFHNTITMLSNAIPMEFPSPLAPHVRPAEVNGGDASC